MSKVIMPTFAGKRVKEYIMSKEAYLWVPWDFEATVILLL